MSYPYTETDNKEMWDEYFTALEGILEDIEIMLASDRKLFYPENKELLKALGEAITPAVKTARSGFDAAIDHYIKVQEAQFRRRNNE